MPKFLRFETVKARELSPNPFRAFTRDPLDDEKIQQLTKSHAVIPPPFSLLRLKGGKNSS
jgi:hypothetical protein